MILEKIKMEVGKAVIGMDEIAEGHIAMIERMGD